MSNELYRYGPSRYIEISKSQHQQQRHGTRRSRVVTLYDAWESKLSAALFRITALDEPAEGLAAGGWAPPVMVCGQNNGG